MKIKRYLIWMVLSIIFFIVVFYIASITGFFAQTQAPSTYDNFASCLSEKGIIMAGTDWCHYCKSQKQMFGTSFRLINYKSCDTDSWCNEVGINGYPTWVFPNGQQYAGVQTLERLSELSGCPLPK
jgi:hypothetical protein